MRRYNKFILVFAIIALIIFGIYSYSKMINHISESEAAVSPNSKFGTINFPKEAATIDYLNQIGVGFLRWNVEWEDLEPSPGVYNFSNFSAQLQPFIDDNKEILIMMATRNPIYCVPYCSGNGKLDTYPHAGGKPNTAARLQAYSNFIAAFVNEFGNRIKFLQIDNEINDFGIYWQDDAVNYGVVLSVAYDTAKNINSSLNMVAAGFSSGSLEKLASGDVATTNLVNNLLIGGKFNYIDLHFYHKYKSEGTFKGIEEKINWFKNRGYNKLISTESSGPDTIVGDVFTESAKSVNLIKRFSIGLERELEKINWLSFNDLPGEDERFRELGLVNIDLSKNPVFFTYKLFIRKITGFSSVEKIGDGKYKFIVNGKSVFILWNDSGATTADLTSYRSSPLINTVKVTHIITEQGKTDADAVINNGVAISSIPIDETPVFVEEEAGSPPPPPPQTGNPCLSE